MKRSMWMGVLAATSCVLAGCSGSGAASAGVGVGKNLFRKDSHLKVYIDGQEGKQSTLKKAATGHARFEVKDPVDTSPRLRFEIEDPDRFGRITMVAMSVFQKHQADYSHQAEFTVTGKSGEPTGQMKPGVEYNLGSPGAEFTTIDLNGKTVGGVALKPGMKYMLTLTVRADRSETAQVYFETR